MFLKYFIKEGQKQSSLSDLQLYEDQKNVFRKQIDEFNHLIEELNPLDESYVEKVTKYMDLADLMNRRMDSISEKIKQHNHHIFLG